MSRRSMSLTYFLESSDESDEEFHDAVDLPEDSEAVDGGVDDVKMRPHAMFMSPSFEMSNERDGENTPQNDNDW